MLSSFLRENVHPISYCTTLPFYARKRDPVWSNEVWRGMSNRSIHHILLDCGSELTVLPCFGYILMGDELFATFPQSIKNMLPSDRGGPSSIDNGAAAVTTVWQLLMNNHHNHQGQFDLKLSNMGDNMYTLRHYLPAGPPTNRIWLERIRFVHDVHHGFSRIQRFLARRAILRKIKARHFTKLVVFIRMITTAVNSTHYYYWRAIQDTGVLSEHIVSAYLGLTIITSSSLEGNRVLKLRGQNLIKTKGRMQLG